MADTIELSSAGTNEATLVSRRAVPFSLTLGPAVIGGGVATGGELVAQNIRVPWSYTLTTAPSDVAIGTALFVDTQVTVDNNNGVGPQFSTGSFGPRGIINEEGLVRYAEDMTAFGFAPVGYADLLAVANDAGAARTLVPSWSYLSARGLIADAATVTVAPNDTNRGGAGFVDSPAVGTVDGGTLDGTTNDYEVTSFYSGGALWGNANVDKKIGLDVEGMLKQTGGFNYAGAGIVDSQNATLGEEIGVRVQQFTAGVLKLGMTTAHPIRLMDTNLTHVGILSAIAIEPARTFTMQTGGQFNGLLMQPTVVFDDDADIFGSGSALNFAPIFKNVQGEARTIGAVFGPIGVNSAPTLRGDGAAVSTGIMVGFRDAATFDIANSGTLAVGALQTIRSEAAIGSGVTVTSRTVIAPTDATGSGTLTTQIVLDIPVLAKGATNIGIRNAATYVATPSTAQIIDAAGDTILANADVVQLNNNTGGSITLTSAPTIANGENGQEVELISVSSAQNIVLQDQGTLASSNLRMVAAATTLGPRDSVKLRYNATIGDWVQSGPVVNVI